MCAGNVRLVRRKHVWFEQSDLSLASFIGVKLSHVGFKKTSLQATSYFDIDCRMVEVLAPRPYQIFAVPESDAWPKKDNPMLVVNPKAALESLRSQFCMPKLKPSWDYAWNKFIQTGAAFARAEPRLESVVQDFPAHQECKELSDHGMRGQTAPRH